MATRNAAYRIYVGNLPWTISRKELKSFFSKFGHVASCSVPFDKETGLSKSYGFVEFSHKDAFLSASKEVSGVLEGNQIKIQPALREFHEDKNI